MRSVLYCVGEERTWEVRWLIGSACQASQYEGLIFDMGVYGRAKVEA